MISPPSWPQLLPQFETPDWCAFDRHNTANAFRRLGWDEAASRACSDARPCRSGLCAVCIRRLRVKLLDFLDRQQLHRLQWHFATVRVGGWNIEAGDMKPFGRLRNHRIINNLVASLRRKHIPGVLVFGSIETVYLTIANKPMGKPFHLHLMISGLPRVVIEQAIEKIGLDRHYNRPQLVKAVRRSRRDFFQVSSYAFKQPLQKKSRISEDDAGRRQSPNASERRELVSNLGLHRWTERLILVGIRCDAGTFRLTADLSATTRSRSTQDSASIVAKKPPAGSSPRS